MVHQKEIQIILQIQVIVHQVHHQMQAHHQVIVTIIHQAIMVEVAHQIPINTILA